MESTLQRFLLQQYTRVLRHVLDDHRLSLHDRVSRQTAPRRRCFI